jgi:hypothetical protein
LGGQTN